MAKKEAFYPTDGSSALKPHSSNSCGRATIIDFPGNGNEKRAIAPHSLSRDMDLKNDYSQLTDLFTRPMNERAFIRSIKEGSLAGESLQNVSLLKGIVAGIALAVASFAIFFL